VFDTVEEQDEEDDNNDDESGAEDSFDFFRALNRFA
jgi:hypothetical protein